MRQSNFELLRIIAMFAIVLHHLIVNAINVVGYNIPFVSNINNNTLLVVNSFLTGGVNCFILISGYFGIKLSKHSVIRLLFDCIIVAFIGVLICYLFSGDTLILKPTSIWNNCKFTHYWFVTHYLILMLLSPIIESSMKSMSYREFTTWLIILIFINLYFGYYLGVVNRDGYNFVNFIMLYYIGRYLRISNDYNWYKIISRYSFYISISVCVVFSFLYIVVSDFAWIKGMKYWAYNSPWVLISSMSIFMYFSNMKINNKWINMVAKGAFGIYLLQGVGAFAPMRNNWAIISYNELGILGLLAYSCGLFLVLATISLLINKCTKKIYNSIK